MFMQIDIQITPTYAYPQRDHPHVRTDIQVSVPVPCPIEIAQGGIYRRKHTGGILFRKFIFLGRDLVVNGFTQICAASQRKHAGAYH